MLHIPGVLTAQQCAEVRRHIDAGRWVDGRATAGSQSASVKHNRQIAANDPAGNAAGAIILSAVGRNPAFTAAAFPARISPPLFSRYDAGEGYGDHIDNAIRPFGGAPMRGDLSATLFLSPPDSYAGGTLVIDTPAGGREIKLPAGDLVVYPSTTIHRVEPVTEGRREVSFFWIQSLVRDAAQREMLTKLDGDIRALSTAGAARPTLLSLAALYNNLLRLWAEP